MRKTCAGILLLVCASLAWGAVMDDGDQAPGTSAMARPPAVTGIPKSGPLLWSTRTAAPLARYWGAVGVRQDTIYLAGGRTGTAASTRTMLAYLPAADAWINPGQPETPPMPGARRAGATGHNDTLMFYVCGRDSASVTTATTYIFNMRTKAWTTGANCPATAWSTAGAVVGGSFFRYGNESYSNPFYRYDISANTWSAVTPATPPGRGWLAAASAQGKFYVIGGIGSGSVWLSDCWAYDTAAGSWTQMASMPVARGYHNAVTVGDSLIMVVGGTSNGSAYDNNVYIYHIGNDTWTTENSMPTVRCWTMPASAYGRVYVLQGYTGSVYLPTNEEALFLIFDHDVGVQAIRAPGTQFSAAGPLAPVVSVRNYGQNPEDFQVACVAESLGVPVYSQTQGVSGLAAGDTQLVTFPEWNAADGEVYDLTAYTILAGDELPDDDTARATANTYSSEHTVMAELFTSSTCSPCVQANNALDALYATWSDSLVVVRYHMNWPSPGNDPFYAANPTESYSRRIYYGVNSVPDFWLNGTSYSYVGTTYEGNMQIERRKLSPVTLALTGAYDSVANAGWVRAVLSGTGRMADPGANLRLRYAVIEDTVYYTGTNGLPVHDQVMRDLFPDTMGTAVSIGKGDTVTDSLGFVYDPAWPYTVEERCHVVAYLQNHATREIYQAARLPFLAMPSGVAGTPAAPGLPAAYQLGQAYPNPFGGTTEIRYQLPKAAAVELCVYNIAGQKVKTLARGELGAGRHAARWDGRDEAGRQAAAGVYLYRLTAPGYSQTGKLSLVR